jgi:phage shock protein PspC (stress-responsive transcriptional regulator)
MKKTLNINIGNSIILIEEDAYEMLTAYLNEIKFHFSKNADHFEIVTDIENRIAEMFREILAQQQKQVISIDDVQSVVAQMGSVKDFENADEADGADYEETLSGVKKLYRDTDEAYIAGVCSGLSHYANIDAKWFRLMFLVSLFFAGSGIVAYLIMWILIPRASTRSQRMYMKGQAVNLHGFIRNFEEELAGNQLISRSRGFFVELAEAAGRIVRTLGKSFFKIIAVIIIVFGSCFFLALLVALAVFFGFWDANPSDYFPLNIVNNAYLSSMVIAFFVAIAIPIIALVLFAIRVAFNSKAINRTVSFALLVVWLGGVMVSIFYITKVASEFKEEAEFTQVRELKKYDAYTLTLDRSRFFSKEDSVKYQINSDKYRGKVILNDMDDPFNLPRNVRLNIEKSDNGLVTLTQNNSAHGKTFENALNHAQNIHYDFSQQDSLLNFSPFLQLNRNTNWRDQEVELTLKVPVGVKLFLNEDMNRFSYSFDYWSCNDDQEGGPKAWVMTEEGLKCIKP